MAQALRGSRRTVVGTFLLLAAAMFVIDLMLPLGIGAGVPYALLVLVGLWYDTIRPTLLTAGGATLLAVSGMFLSPAGVSLPFAAVNRGIAVAVIWALALVLLRQKLTKQQLLEEQRGTRGLLDIVDVVIVQLDDRGIVSLINRKGCEVLGWSEAEIVGKEWFENFLPERMRAEVRRVYRRLMNVEAEAVEHFENPVLTRDGDERIIAWHNTILHGIDGKITGTLSSGMDITERKKTEEELRRREALAQVGQMATVVAHEVRNPLAGIAGALQIIGGRLDEASPEHEITDEILQRIDALNELVGSLLLYARPRTPRIEPLRIGSLLQSTVDMARRDPAFARVDVDLATGDLVLPGDAELLKILFTNLLLNAGQAMEGHGRIQIDLKLGNDACEVSLADDGPVMSPEVRQRVFEPFFTTKSRGTGLGMAISRQVVEAHRGEISVDCPPRGGTTVTVRLPAGSWPD